MKIVAIRFVLVYSLPDSEKKIKLSITEHVSGGHKVEEVVHQLEGDAEVLAVLEGVLHVLIAASRQHHARLIRTGVFKVIRKLFFKTITKVLDGISGITKIIIFFHLKACERRNFDFCMFLRMSSGSDPLDISSHRPSNG